MKPVITPSGEDYLETILVLQKKLGMVRSVDVARHLEVTKPSVCHAVATLRDGGFLTMDEDHFLHLTDVGREVAEKIYERHCFFTEQLIAAGVDPKTAEADACRIEHIISDESFSRLKEAAAQDQEYKNKPNKTSYPAPLNGERKKPLRGRWLCARNLHFHLGGGFEIHFKAAVPYALDKGVTPIR